MPDGGSGTGRRGTPDCARTFRGQGINLHGTADVCRGERSLGHDRVARTSEYQPGDTGWIARGHCHRVSGGEIETAEIWVTAGVAGFEGFCDLVFSAPEGERE